MKYINKFNDKNYISQWVDTSELLYNSEMSQNCTVEFVQNALRRFPDVVVDAVEIISEGQTTPPCPDYCFVKLSHSTGKHTEHIHVCVPFAWNQRYLGIGAGGSYVGIFFVNSCHSIGYQRCWDMSTPLKNGFATAMSDGGYVLGDDTWPVPAEGEDLDTELLNNWLQRSSHNACVYGKAVTEALQGRKILYSYFMGTSGGGRQGLSHAMYNPNDYDGIYVDAPAINWWEMNFSNCWPAILMNEEQHFLPVSKLEEFRNAVWEEYGGKEAFFSYDNIKRSDFRAEKAIGRDTINGPITTEDARIMQMIWDGPDDKDGNLLWYGFRPGCESWCEVMPNGQIMYADNNAVPSDIDMFHMGKAIIGCWALHHKDCTENWDWHTVSVDEFRDMYVKARNEQQEWESNSVDFRKFSDAGNKIILSQGTNDDVIPFDGTVDFYKRTCAFMGGKEQVEKFMHFYPVQGDAHSCSIKSGCGPIAADVMINLMRWVEEGVEPGDLAGFRLRVDDPLEDGYTPFEIVEERAIPFLSLDPDLL